MKSIIIFFVIILSGVPGYSQSSVMNNLSDLTDQYTLEKSKNNFLSISEVDGSPFLNDQFVKGNIVVNDSMMIVEVPLRYNIYSDRIEFLNEDDQIMEIGILDNSFTYRIQDQQFITLDYSDRGKDKRGILELLVDGNARLYKQYIIHFKEATKTIGYQDAQPNRFIRQKEEYLLATGQDKPETIRKTKAVLEELENIKPDIAQFSESENLKLKTEEGLIKLIQYCNN